MAKTVSKKEMADVFVDFLNNASMFWEFKAFIEEQGYTLEEFEISED